MHIRIRQCAGVTRHPARRLISRKRVITKTRKHETKCRRLPEPQHSLCMHFTVRFVEAWTIADRRRSPAPRPVQRRASLSSPGSFANTASPAHRHLGYPRASGPRWSGAVSRWPARSPRAGRHRRRRDTDGVGALATIGVRRPQNLSIAVFDNGRYGETGMQAGQPAFSLPAVACACGIEHAFDITNEPAPRVLPPRDGALLKTRFSPRHWC